MPVENSELNTSPALPASNAGLTGGSGSGNKFLLSELAQGFTKEADPEAVPHWLPTNSDDGENFVGDTFHPPQGFAGRPNGFER